VDVAALEVVALEVAALDAAAMNVEKRFTGDVPAEV
jgi:hypothetical protein